MSCEPQVPPQEPTNPPDLKSPGETILVLDSEQPMIRTNREETDAVWAMRRGLMEYLGGVSKDVEGATVAFKDVFEEWATSEDEAVDYPSAAVLLPDGNVMYDAHNFSPTIYPSDQLPDGRYVVKVSEASTEFSIEVHCDSPGQRKAVAMLLEETMNPVVWMYGFQLDLPHYFGQRALFACEAVNFTDDETSTRHGLRPIRLRVSATISVVRPRNITLAKPALDFDTFDGGAVIGAGTLP